MINTRALFLLPAVALSIGACAIASDVEEEEGGTYMISARAAPIRGGTTGAHTVAYEDAQKFCGKTGGRPVVVGSDERDIYQSSSGASFGPNGGGAYSGTAASGTVNLHFKCVASGSP
jgi:hypothetical protein